jgi:hypothetical protein
MARQSPYNADGERGYGPGTDIGREATDVARRVRCLGLLVVLCLTAAPSWAAMAPEAGGVLVTLAGWGREAAQGYRQYEGYVAWPLKWKREWPSGWRARTELHASVGDIRLNGEEGLMASLGPVAGLVSPDGSLEVHAGCRPTGLTRTHYPPMDVGLWFQFTSHAGVAVRLARRLWLGVRVQHMSNAGADDSNPGINMTTFEVRGAW